MRLPIVEFRSKLGTLVRGLPFLSRMNLSRYLASLASLSLSKSPVVPSFSRYPPAERELRPGAIAVLK